MNAVTKENKVRFSSDSIYTIEDVPRKFIPPKLLYRNTELTPHMGRHQYDDVALDDISKLEKNE